MGFWPQGVPRPQAAEGSPRYNGMEQGRSGRSARARRWAAIPFPARFRGICSSASDPIVPYHPIYHPFNWRGWADWGCGAIGDMGAHLLDVTMWSLKLGLPTSIETVSSPFNGASYPTATMTFYEFAAREVDAAGETHLVRRRPDATQAGRNRRRRTEEGRRRAADRYQGQADARYLRRESAAASKVAAGFRGQASAEAAAHREGSITK